MSKFDLVIIGAGPSGYAAAMRALDFRKRVLLVERGKVGGAGVTNGALSSKTPGGAFPGNFRIHEKP